MIRIRVRVRILGPSLWALICLGLLNRGVGPKSMVPTMPPFFQLGRSVVPGWKNTVFLTCLSLGKGDPYNLCVPSCTFLGGFLFLITHLI